MPIEAGKKINRPHWKEKYEEQCELVESLQQEVQRLRANGADKVDLVRIKSESFAAGVAAASAHFAKA